MSEPKVIGRIVATEKKPTTMDTFAFWTDSREKLHAFDMVKVRHIDESYTFGVITSISHITDAQSFMTEYISSDFGNPDVVEATERVSMNYVEASVAFNSREIYTPVLSGEAVMLASAEEITTALGLQRKENTLVCGQINMYEGREGETLAIPVKLDPRFLIGPEGAHLNISGISGLAAKTSYAMFLLKAAQEHYMTENQERVAYVLFNVKGKDLMAIHEPNGFEDEEDGGESVREAYRKMGLSGRPFENVRYFIPYTSEGRGLRNTYLAKGEEAAYLEEGILKKFKYVYSEDKESIEMFFADIDDPQQTMEAILSKIIDEDDPDFSTLETWNDFRGKVNELSQKSGGGNKTKSNEISVLSWRKFKRIINKVTKNDDMFAQRADGAGECRLKEMLKEIKGGDVFVIDVAKLSEDKQAFVFGDALRTIYNLKLGEYDDESGVEPPTRIVVFIDELNKYASKETPKNSPILREILDVTERGRSLGVVLFGAEQFRSNIHSRVTGNCATHAYGRTNTIEAATKDYSSFPQTYKNILTRLGQGDYLIQNPIFRSLLKIHFPKPIYKQFKG